MATNTLDASNNVEGGAPDTSDERVGKFARSVLTGGAAGAAIGSVIPVVGPIVGSIVVAGLSALLQGYEGNLRKHGTFAARK